MFEWFLEIPLWLRALVGLGLLAVSSVIWFAGWFWPWGWVVGGIILLASIPSGRRSSRY